MRKPGVILAGLAVLVAAGLTWVALALSSPADPAAGLDGKIGIGSGGGNLTTPGVPADYTGYLGNHTGQVVILKSATLLPLAGFKAPRLVHLAVEPGRDVVAADRGWPPDSGQGIAPFAAHRVLSGHRVQILYSVEASRPGEYADAGIRVTVLVSGVAVTVDVVSPAPTCVRPTLNVKHDCPQSFYNRVWDTPVNDS